MLGIDQVLPGLFEGRPRFFGGFASSPFAVLCFGGVESMHFSMASRRTMVSFSVYHSGSGVFAMAKEPEFAAQTQPLSAALFEQSELFYATVGQGISHWSAMETRLVQIVAKLLKTSDEKAGLIMYSIANFHTWLMIIDELFCIGRNSQ
jgi:hypothetical protein